MRYTEYRPSARFARLVECYWFLDDDDDGGHAILPDGRLEVVFRLDGESFQRHVSGRLDRQPRSLLIGQMTEPVTLVRRGRTRVAAIRLRPVAGRVVLQLPAEETTRQILDLGCLRRLAFDVPVALQDAADDRARVVVLEAYLATMCDAAAPLAAVETAVDAIARSEGRIRMTTLAARQGLQPRQFERLFAREVGLPPKTLATIVRLHGALRRTWRWTSATSLAHRPAPGTTQATPSPG